MHLCLLNTEFAECASDDSSSSDIVPILLHFWYLDSIQLATQLSKHGKCKLNISKFLRYYESFDINDFSNVFFNFELIFHNSKAN